MAEREDRGPGIAARVFPDARRSVYIPSGGSGRGLTGGTAVKSRSRPGRSAKDEFAIANCHRRGASTPANADRIFDAQPPVHPSHRCWRSRTGKGIAGLPDRALTDQQHDLLLNGLAQRRPALLSSNCDCQATATTSSGVGYLLKLWAVAQAGEPLNVSPRRK